MKTKTLKTIGVLAMLLICQDGYGWGFRGGGGGRGGGSFGGARAGGGSFGGARAGGGFSRPQMQARPSMPNLGGSRGQSRPQLNRPNISRPSSSGSRSFQPSGAFKPYQPSGGFKPSTRPQVIDNRPNTLPGRTRPNVPNLGGSRPNLPNIGNNRPGISRPSPGNVGDFLGMDRPLKPNTRPGTIINQPGVNRPNIGNRINAGGNDIGNRVNGSNIGNRINAGGNHRTVNVGNVNVGNKVINNRPSWANINNTRLTGINNRWQSQLGGLGNWQTRNPRRTAYWNGWGNGVRSHWGNYVNRGWFNQSWWLNHRHGWGGWHYGYAFNRYPYSYWWTVPTFAALTNWFTWTAPAGVWTQPVYYDYGTGGNVVYQDNSVYVNNQPVATADEFAESAAALATVAPPANEEAAEAAQWMPLGTFAVSANEKDVNPSRVVQLAVDKQGVISGTLYNSQTDETQTIQGKVDKQTQRVAFRIGESEDIIAETGLYNLTQDQAPVLVHFGKDKVENYLLVRMQEPEAQNQTPAS